MNILAISGSLRAESHNSALLRAVARLAPPHLRVEVYDGLGQLPLFNPDLEAADPPAVASLRARLVAADAVLIASPEYAHGVTGALKNALDWMVGCEAFVGKPVALLNASPRAVHAQASLKEIVRVMSADLVEEASITLSILGSKLDEEGIVAHHEVSRRLVAALQSLGAAVGRSRSGGSIRAHPRARISLITLAVDDLERAVAFYRDGLGWPTRGIVGAEFENGAVAFFELESGPKLALWPRSSLAADSGLALQPPSATDMALAHNVTSRDEVDLVLQQVARAGATIVKPAQATFYGGYAGYFQDPDGHLWEVAFNPGFDALG